MTVKKYKILTKPDYRPYLLFGSTKILKFFMALVMLIFVIQISSAQFSNEWLKQMRNKHLLYANGDLMSGQDPGGGLGMCFVYKQKLSLQVGFTATSNDFNTQVNDILKSSENKVTNMIMENYHIMLGRYIYLNTKQTIRIVIQGGPGLSKMVESVEYISPIDNKNRSFHISTSDYLSAVFNSKIEFPVTEILGFAAGPTLIINSYDTYIGFAAGFIFGVLTTD